MFPEWIESYDINGFPTWVIMYSCSHWGLISCGESIRWLSRIPMLRRDMILIDIPVC